MLEVPPLDVDFRDALNAPADTQVAFLVLPVLCEDDTPERAEQGVDGRKVAEEEPRKGTESSCRDKEGEVGLREGKVECNLRGLVRPRKRSLGIRYLLA
jgi:hypothetical protein